MKEKAPINPHSPEEKGQSLVEFALSVSFVLLLLVGIMDFGYAFFTMVMLRDAAQEGATYGAICPDDLAGVADRLRESAREPINLSAIRDDQIQICFTLPGSDSCGAPMTLGNDVQVTVSYPHEIMTPFMGSILGTQEYTLTVSATDSLLRISCPDHIAGTP